MKNKHQNDKNSINSEKNTKEWLIFVDGDKNFTLNEIISHKNEKIVICDQNLSNDKKITVNCEEISQINTEILFLMKNFQKLCINYNLECNFINISPEALQLLEFVDLRTPSKKSPEKSCGWVSRLGILAIDFCGEFKELFVFFLTVLKQLARCVILKTRTRFCDILEFIQQTSIEALPIVALISTLVGLIMAFVSVIQLERFGASIYVADLVSLAMTREMGCLMLGVIMSGRTGAAFAASLGSMQVNEELDALQTFGINKVDFLVIPRVLALTLMMPLLCIFADLIGIIGGMLSSLPFINGSLFQYLLQTKNALAMSDIILGLVKSIVFGLIIGTVGCFNGLKCGRNADSVGYATTSSVVQGITYIIIADAIFAVITTILGI